MITNNTTRIMKTLAALPEIKQKNSKPQTSGMMAPVNRSMKKAQASSKEKQPIKTVIQMYQSIRRSRNGDTDAK